MNAAAVSSLEAERTQHHHQQQRQQRQHQQYQQHRQQHTAAASEAAFTTMEPSPWLRELLKAATDATPAMDAVDATVAPDPRLRAHGHSMLAAEPEQQQQQQQEQQLPQQQEQLQERDTLAASPEQQQQQPQQQQQRLRHLAQLLGGDAGAADQAARRCPRLLAHNPAQLDAHAASLRALLDLKRSKQLAKAVATFPQLLTYDPDILHSRVQALAEGLGSKPLAVRTCRKTPLLLGCQAAKLQGNIACLESLLGSRQEVVRAVSRHAALLGSDPDALKRNAKSLQQLLGLDTSKQVMVGLFSRCPLGIYCRQPMLKLPDTFDLDAWTKERLQITKACLLPSPPLLPHLTFSNIPQLVRVVGRQPTLLSCRPDSLRRNMHMLPEGLGMAHGEVQQMCASQPQIMACSSSTIFAKVRMATWQ